MSGAAKASMWGRRMRRGRMGNSPRMRLVRATSSALLAMVLSMSRSSALPSSTYSKALNPSRLAASTTVKNRVSRSRSDMLGGLPQHVAYAAHRVDQARLAARLQLVAQVAHVHVQHVRLGVVLPIPHTVQDLVLSQHLAWVAHEIRQ